MTFWEWLDGNPEIKDKLEVLFAVLMVMLGIPGMIFLVAVAIWFFNGG